MMLSLNRLNLLFNFNIKVLPTLATLFIFIISFSQSNNMLLNGNLDKYDFVKHNFLKSSSEISDSFFIQNNYNTSVLVENWGLGILPIDSSLTMSGKVYISLSVYDIVIGSNNTYQFNNRVGKLCKELIQDEKYLVEFYVKPFSGDLFTNKLEVLLTDSYTSELIHKHIKVEKVKKNYVSTNMNNITPSFSNQLLLTDTVNYTKISFEYTAKGNEKYLIIGNITATVPEKIEFVKSYGNFNGKIGRHFIVDDLSVFHLNSEVNPCIDSYFEKNEMLINSEANFYEILFEVDKDTAEFSIGQFNDFNNNFPNLYKIEITGFADNTGSLIYNQNLALRRAENYKKFLQENNVQVIIEAKFGAVLENNSIQNRKIEVNFLGF